MRDKFKQIAIFSGKLSVGLGFSWFVLKIIFSSPSPGVPVQRSLPMPVMTSRTSETSLDSLDIIVNQDGTPIGSILIDDNQCLLDIRNKQINPNLHEFLDVPVMFGLNYQTYTFDKIRYSEFPVSPNIVFEPVDLCLSREDYASSQLSKKLAPKPLNEPSEHLKKALNKLNKPHFEELLTDHYQLFQWMKWYNYIFFENNVISLLPGEIHQKVETHYMRLTYNKTRDLKSSIDQKIKQNPILCQFTTEQLSNFYYHEIYSLALEAYDVAEAEAEAASTKAQEQIAEETQIIPTADEIAEEIAAAEEADATLSRMQRLKRGIGISTVVFAGLSAVGRVLLWLI